ncbi:MAG: LysE family translocator [Pseudomonadota bacterium]
MDPSLLALFFVAAATFAFVPGPSIVYLIGRTLAGGKRAGLAAMAGVHAGGYVHVIAATAGLTALFELVPAAYTALKLAGAAYVIWLGFRLLTRPESLTGGPGQKQKLSFWQSFLTEFLNPTTALFFLAFLPQFASPEAALPLPVQLLILGIATNLLFSLADLPYVLAAGKLREKITQTRLAQRIQRAGGAILVGLGLHLAFSRSSP